MLLQVIPQVSSRNKCHEKHQFRTGNHYPDEMVKKTANSRKHISNISIFSFVRPVEAANT